MTAEPNACRWCGLPAYGHYQRWKPPVGWHAWEQPTQQQTKERMLVRRASRPTVGAPCDRDNPTPTERNPMADEPARPHYRYAEGDDPYTDSPNAGDDTACNCGGAWHASKQHCVDWPCPGCTRICPPAPGTEWNS